MSYVDGRRDARGWAFRASNGPDPVNGFTLLREAYDATEPGFDGHVSVPTLWDRTTGTVASNQFATIGIDLATQFRAFATPSIDTYPAELAADIEALDRWIGPAVNQGVNAAAADTPAGRAARTALLDAFAELERRLSNDRFLLGERVTEADIRLFVTLVRYDAGANADRTISPGLDTFPNLWAYARDLYAIPAFRSTTRLRVVPPAGIRPRRLGRAVRPRRPRVGGGPPMTAADDRHVHLAVGLDGAGCHPAAWRDPSARPTELFTARYWVDLARAAERGLLDLITIEDSFGMQTGSLRRIDDRTDQVRGRLDAVLIASLVAPATQHIGLRADGRPRRTPSRSTSPRPSPRSTTSARAAAGWQAQVSGRPRGRRTSGGVRPASPATDPRRCVDLFDEATDAVEVVRRLWDSWEDDAIIKDVATGRFVDRDKLHYVDFEGRFFSVKGPSIVPRPPQGQPLVAALAHQPVPFEFAARRPTSCSSRPPTPPTCPAGSPTSAAPSGRSAATAPPLRIFADLVVFLADSRAEAAARRGRARRPGRLELPLRRGRVRRHRRRARRPAAGLAATSASTASACVRR